MRDRLSSLLRRALAQAVDDNVVVMLLAAEPRIEEQPVIASHSRSRSRGFSGPPLTLSIGLGKSGS